MAVFVGIGTHHRDADFDRHVSNRDFLHARPCPSRVVARQDALDQGTPRGGLDEVISVPREQLIVVERTPNRPRHGRTAVRPIDVVCTPRQICGEGDVGTARSVDHQGSAGLVDVALHDDAAAVLFKSAPEHPRSRALAVVLHPEVQGEHVTGLHREVDHLTLAFKQLGIVV